MTRLSQFARLQAAKDRLNEQRADVDKHLNASADSLEFAARVIENSYKARQQRAEESDVFRIGYATCAKEAALVLRSMRRGVPPTEEEMRGCREEAMAEAGIEVGETVEIPKPESPLARLLTVVELFGQDMVSKELLMESATAIKAEIDE